MEYKFVWGFSESMRYSNAKGCACVAGVNWTGDLPGRLSAAAAELMPDYKGMRLLQYHGCRHASMEI